MCAHFTNSDYVNHFNNILLVFIFFIVSCGPSTPENTSCEVIEREFYEGKGVECMTTGPIEVLKNETENKVNPIGAGVARLVSKDVRDFNESYDSRLARMAVLLKSYDEEFLLGKEARLKTDGNAIKLDDEVTFGRLVGSEDVLKKIIVIDLTDEDLYKIATSKDMKLKVGGIFFELPSDKVSDQAAFVYNKSR